MLRKSLIPIGLFVHEGNGSVFPFAAAAPKESYQVQREDKVYVIKVASGIVQT